jgi:predicted HTH transcriptional regulator
MEAIELLNIISTGETSKVQFKEKMPHRDSISQEIVAMSNALGGVILLGVQDVSGEAKGLTQEEIESYDRIIAEIADNTKPVVMLLLRLLQ